MTICKHRWEKSDIHGYNRCKDCGTYTLINAPDTGIYKADYWSHDHNRSTLEEQFNNLNWEYNDVSKADKVMSFVGGGNKALEIGCAPGNILQKLADTHTMAYGIEVDAKNLPEIKRITNRDNTRLWEGFFPYDFFGLRDGVFDTVIAMDVLEHVDDPEWFVSRCADIMSGTGTLVVMTPILQPGVDMPVRMWNTEEHTWVFSLEHIMQIFTKFFSVVETDSWHPGHEIIVGKNKRQK
jgi:2-polyprenyl-3-methyl-5-hydroxy-6-metoxy-1,4-benzoquinol methylase